LTGDLELVVDFDHTFLDDKIHGVVEIWIVVWVELQIGSGVVVAVEMMVVVYVRVLPTYVVPVLVGQVGMNDVVVALGVGMLNVGTWEDMIVVPDI